MANDWHISDPVERDVALGLWTVEGLGPVTLTLIRERIGGGSLAGLLKVLPAEWADASGLKGWPLKQLLTMDPPGEVAERVREVVAEEGICLSWRGDEDYPELLLQIPDPPPVLFRLGKVGVRRRRVAMVGSRAPEGGFLTWAGRLARDVAASGVGIVSGGAIGVDRACHYGALAAGGETWAFLGSGLDQVDPAQLRVSNDILRGGGCIFSELPPRKRASKDTFPRRNRLISGASDAVVILRGTEKSGTRHTAEKAELQGRPVYAVPGDPWNEMAQLPLRLLREGKAKVCARAEDLFEAVGWKPDRVSLQLPPGRSLAELGLSEEAHTVLGALSPGRPRVLEAVAEASGMEVVPALCALGELESVGLLVQHPGRMYERV